MQKGGGWGQHSSEDYRRAAVASKCGWIRRCRACRFAFNFLLPFHLESDEPEAAQHAHCGGQVLLVQRRVAVSVADTACMRRCTKHELK